MKTIIFGVGQFYVNRKDCFKRDDIIAYCDNNVNLQGKLIDGVRVVSPDEILNYDFDAICIMAGDNFDKKIRNQLAALCIPEEKIFSFREYFATSGECKMCSYRLDNNKSFKLAYFVPNFANTGGIRASLYAISILQKFYKSMVVISASDGEVCNEMKEMGVSIIITPDLSEKNSELWDKLSEVELYFLNGLYFSYLIPYLNKKKKQVIWWVHSGESFYESYPLPNVSFDTGTAKVFGVSPIVKEAYMRHNNKGKMELLPFGIPDERPEQQKGKNDKFVFVMIGRITKIKGFDIVIKAVKLLPYDALKKIEVWFIGADGNEKYTTEVKDISKDISQIKWLGAKSHSKTMLLLNQADVLISASQEDMLPIVVSEGLMCEKPCIVSDAVGTAPYITHEKNSLIFKHDSVENLAEMMMWCLQNRDKLEEIGIGARELFEKEFSMSVFEKRLINCLK